MITATGSDHCGEDLPAYVNSTLDAERARAVELHLTACAVCRAEEADWRAAGLAAQTAFASGSAPRGLLDRIWLEVDADRRSGSGTVQRLRGWFSRPASGRLWARPRALAAGVAAVACLLIAAYAGARADNLFQVFRPQQISVVPVTLQDLQSLSGLANYGTLTTDQSRLSQATTLDTPETAAAAAGIAVRTPASLPADVPPSATYAVVPGSSTSFTFSADKARAAAAAQGKDLPPLPAGLDGATLQLVTEPAVLAIYGGRPAADGSEPAAGAGLGSIPALVIGETAAPKVVASGASASDIERYLLSQPGISPQLAAAIRALGAPGSAWPVPIPVEAVSSRPVRVQGVKGIAIGDSTGLGAGILWQKDGVVYAVAGTLSQTELLSIANSLH